MRTACLALVVATSLLATGCIASMLTNGTIASTREASDVLDQMGDYELARSAVQAGNVQSEGFHKLAPDNEDALFMLVQGWAGYAWGFCEDDMEVAEDAGNDALADYHRKRAKMAYDRAIFYGLELIGHEDGGFQDASKSEPKLQAWLKEHFATEADAQNLFWLGYAWMSRVNLLQDDPAMVADLYIGVDFMERSMQLDPDYYASSAMVAMAAYHGRAANAEVAEARKLFDQALAKTHRKALTVQLTEAQFACTIGDRKLYESLLREVLAADDPDPAQRLNNVLAKRRAARYLNPKREADCGFVE